MNSTSIQTSNQFDVFTAEGLGFWTAWVHRWNEELEPYGYTSDWRVTDFGGTGDGPGAFGHAMALDVAADGTVYLVDFLNNRVQIWKPENMGQRG